jgi:hypothetical protein
MTLQQRDDMPKFFVKIKEVHTQVIEVDAEDEQSAQAAAEEVLSTGVNQDGSDLPEAVVYGYTLDRNEWPVWQ